MVDAYCRVGRADELRQEGLGLSLLWALLRGRARGLNLVMHNFMSAHELAQSRDQVARERPLAHSGAQYATMATGLPNPCAP